MPPEPAHPAAPTTNPPIVGVRGVSKSFGDNQVLKDIDFSAHPGEIHALLGANGAGKSTLIKILSDFHAADRGTVTVRSCTKESSPGRIGVVHQDLGLVDSLTVNENFHLSRNGGITRFGLVARRQERRETDRALKAIHLAVDPEAMLGELSLGSKSLVAIARLLAADADALLLDEVTAALTRSESDRVLTEIRRIADDGRAIIVVSHRLHEIVEHCDVVTILRDGIVAYSGPTPALEELRILLGSAGEHAYQSPPPASAPPAVVLDLQGAVTDGAGPVDLQVRAGEVVAVVGSLASGLYQIGHMAAGMAPVRSGRRRLGAADPAVAARCAFVPEDRRAQGILPLLEVSANLTVSAQRSATRGGLWIDQDAEAAMVDDAMRMLSVHPADPAAKIESLSGGNQQKVLMGRARLIGPDLLVLCEPTRGVDIATRRAIYRSIEAARREGCAVLVVTIDIDDALAVGDRIGVVEGGRVVELLDHDDADPLKLIERVS